MAPPVGTNDQHKPHKTKGNASFQFLQQAYFDLRFGLRLKIGPPPASAMPPPRVTVYVPDPRLGNANSQLDGFIIAGGCGLFCIHDGVGLIMYPTFFVKRKKGVGSVGCVAQSEKSTENSQQKVSRNDYTTYIGYISRLGRVEYRANQLTLFSEIMMRIFLRTFWATRWRLPVVTYPSPYLRSPIMAAFITFPKQFFM